MIKRIAILLTCHNRKDKTINCLRYLFEAYAPYESQFSIAVYLTDDGSTDGTHESVTELFPAVIILQGSGHLYWNGGMRNSWTEAVKKDYDMYFLLNDDTNVMMNVFNDMLVTHAFSLAQYGMGGIYVGSTKDTASGKMTYGGARIKNKWLFTYQHIEPNGIIQECELTNGNILFISNNVIKEIGIMTGAYTHAISDYDYSLSAKKYNIPVLVTPGFCGECSKNEFDKYDRFSKLSFANRIVFLKNPLGFAFNDNLYFMKKHYPYRLPMVFVTGWFKVLFPGVYKQLNKFR